MALARKLESRVERRRRSSETFYIKRNISFVGYKYSERIFKKSYDSEYKLYD